MPLLRRLARMATAAGVAIKGDRLEPEEYRRSLRSLRDGRESLDSACQRRRTVGIAQVPFTGSFPSPDRPRLRDVGSFAGGRCDITWLAYQPLDRRTSRSGHQSALPD